ncbi:MAG: arginine--tRNA ligase [Lachnospiraceae bacterium]|jgi:arginyl-tRNA synthetase|nr:arginine--tRNA ligase [Lachnospiraceae bacterium]
MKKILDEITEVVSKAFKECGYDEKYGKVTVSNRPDLCEFQCNGAMACAKEAHKAPFMIADEIKAVLDKEAMFETVDSVKPGFLNIKMADVYMANYMKTMLTEEHFGVENAKNPRTIVIDYGGANVAKPLHVGHLRPAIIGESIKRILRYTGNTVYGDVHLGDWGLQIGLIITELKRRKPELPYFDESFTGEYPSEPPFTLADLEEIYPAASAESKKNAEYKKEALEITNELQNGHRAYTAILKHILTLSHADLKKNYGNLNVIFDLWKGESDAQPYIPDMIEDMKKRGIAEESDGALIVKVAKDDDKREIPPCIIQKSDGAALYATTDLGTIIMRREEQNPDAIIYVVDKRQELHFVQVFRTTRKAGLVRDDVELTHIGFGTMNGKDGKPFKTRDGGVMRLENMISDIADEMYKKITENHTVDPEEAKKTAKIVGLAALKYGDLSNQASKDYVFDMDRFTSFEGNTGPYLLYSIVRIKSILAKYAETGKNAADYEVLAPKNKSEKELMLALANFQGMIENAAEEYAPHKVCAYIYELANKFNHFYHETKIMSEEDEKVQGSYIRMLELTKGVMETCIDLLGFEAPERM